MKVRVLSKVFKNKATGTYHLQGEVIELTKNRYEEVAAKGKFVEPVHSKKTEGGSDATPETTPPNPDDKPEA